MNYYIWSYHRWEYVNRFIERLLDEGGMLVSVAFSPRAYHPSQYVVTYLHTEEFDIEVPT